MEKLRKEWKTAQFWKNQAFACLGSLMFALGYCLFAMPQKLYSGNFTGIAQIIQTLLERYVDLRLPFDLTGIFLYIINVPLLVLAWKKIGKCFFAKSLVCITLESLFLSLVPIPAQPLVEDPLTSSIIAALIGGFGGGLILRSGSSGGGTDIIGMYCTKKYPDFSVGKVSLMIGAVVYCVCLFLYDVETVVYSAIFTTVYGVVLDRAHYQNIKNSAMVITKNQNLEALLLHSLGRGVTGWEGEGCYTHQRTYIYLTVVSKFEARRLKQVVHQADPNAFVIFYNDINVDGYFEKRL